MFREPHLDSLVNVLGPGLGLVERHVDGLVQAGAQAVDEPVRVALVLRLLLGHRDEQVGEDAVEVEAAVLAIIIIITTARPHPFDTKKVEVDFLKKSIFMDFRGKKK